MTPAQLRMARAGLKLTVREVEAMTGVNKNTVSRYEAEKEILAGALQKIEELFRKKGVIFLEPDSSGGSGVRLCPPKLDFAIKAAAGKRNFRKQGRA